MLRIGCHLSCSKGFLSMGKEATLINANTFQFFTRNPRGGKAKEINPDDIASFLSYSRKYNITTLLAHAPYTLNPCSAKEDLRTFAKETMADDLARMDYLPGNYYNFHPGSHTGQGIETGINQISQLLNEVLREDLCTTVLLETMSGKGSEVGSRFEELQEIIRNVTLQQHLGVCLDTCHVWDAGYDIVNDLDSVLHQFDQTIGLDHLKAIHLNDSLNPLGSHKDRHAKIGEGHIGIEAILKIINHPKLYHLPFFLETPNELSGYAKEISLLRKSYQY